MCLYLRTDDKVRRKRIASGGNAAKQFVEGWIEFAEKKVAKNVRGLMLLLA
jgi:hypothetical protein